MKPRLDFESVNAPAVMTPWEVRDHIVFLLGDAVPAPQLPALQQALLAFSRRWHALWSCYGESRDGWPRYRALLDATWPELLAKGVDQVGLKNELGLARALSSYVFDMALADKDTRSDAARLDRHGEYAAKDAPAPVVHSQGRRRSAIRPPGVHRQSAAFGFHPVVRDPGRRAGRVHHRRRKPPADRGDSRTGARAEQPRLQSPVGRRRHARGGGQPARTVPARAARSRWTRAGCRCRAHAGEDSQERPARAVPCGSVPGGTLHLSAPRSAPGAGQHDRRLAVGPLRDVSEAPGLERIAVVVPADPRLARTWWPATGGDRRPAVGRHDAESCWTTWKPCLRSAASRSTTASSWPTRKARSRASANGRTSTGTGRWAGSCRIRVRPLRPRIRRNGVAMRAR